MKKFFAVICCVAVCGLILSSCEKMQPKSPEENAGSPNTERAASQAQMVGQNAPLATGTVATIAITSANGPANFSVEIAESDQERLAGLMNRESLGENAGMWFIFPLTGNEKFWMKNTKISLDLIYVDENMKVVHVIENAVPESTEPMVSPVSFRYVLEVNAGSAAKRGIKVGDAVEKRIGPQ